MIKQKISFLYSFFFPFCCLSCRKSISHFSFCEECQILLYSLIEEMKERNTSQVAYLFPMQGIGKRIYQHMQNYRLHTLISSFCILALTELLWPWPGQIQCGFSYKRLSAERGLYKKIKKCMGNFSCGDPILYVYPSFSRQQLLQLKQDKKNYHFVIFLVD